MSADEELKDESLCARFKTEEQVEQFRAAFQKGKDLINAASGRVSTARLSIDFISSPAAFQI